MIQLPVCPTCGKPYTHAKRCDCLTGQKPDEVVVCRNATVLVDSKGVLSWIDNEQEIVELRE